MLMRIAPRPDHGLWWRLRRPDGRGGTGTWSDTGPAGRLAAALTARGAGVGECGMGYPATGCTLCGTDNVEARETAGATDACTQNGSRYVRFAHVEQSQTLRARPYQVMIDVFDALTPH
jgi:hypothetical protein